MTRDEISSQELNLKIASLNTWLIPEYIKIAKKTQVRLRELTEGIKQCEYDILALQEVWLPALYTKSILNPDNFGRNLKYFHYFRSGVMGSGLVTFSKYPIIGIDFLKFSLCSDPLSFNHGDWYGSKGIGVCYISTPIGVISVYNTHLVASYPNNDYVEHRIVEAFEVVKFIHQSKRGHVILLGDLNSDSKSVEYQIITKFGGLLDLWKGEDDTFTFNLPENPFYKPKEHPMRIDFVMLPSENEFKVLNKSIVFEKTECKSLWYSDHSGLHVELELKPFQSPLMPLKPDFSILYEAKNILERKLRDRPRLSNFKTTYFLFSRMFLISFLVIAFPIGYALATLIFEIQWMFPYILILLIVLLLTLLSFLFMFISSINGLVELNRLRLEIVRIEMLLQSDVSGSEERLVS